ncbi:MAG: asparaginase [Actinobacteria bacterium]|nr:asparaginase [Actinomycetota bacterium]
MTQAADDATGTVAVQLLSLGGTIAMVGDPARPALDGDELARAIDGLDHTDLEVRALGNLPSAHLDLGGALAAAREIIAAALAGPVVVTHGTDTLEEVAFLTDLLYDGEHPIVFTGAMRAASAPSADGAQNMLDALAVARSRPARGLGVLVTLGGEVHAARYVRKENSVSPLAFASPQTGPLGRVVENEVALNGRLERLPCVAPATLDARVDIVLVALGDEARQITLSREHGADAIVVALLGAGHGSPQVLAAIQESVEAGIPVALTCRPRVGRLLRGTYGFHGSERSMRATGALPAGMLSPVAARVLLLVGLGARLDPQGLAALFASFDR